MGTSYPDRTNARGIWKLSDITRNINTEGTFPNGGARGLWMGGGSPGIDATVDFITFSTSGNATDFGDLSAARDLNGGGANFTRALCTGGQAPGVSDVMDYVAIASTGNFADFGNLTDARGYTAGMANNTRQVTTGGLDPSHSNIMDFVEIATLGNAVDFGDTTNVTALHTCQGSPTRGINAGGVHNPGSVTNLNIINFFQFSTLGNAIDFGDLTATQRSQSSFGSRTRMCMAGGQAPGTTKIEKIEIGSLGNATDFAEAISGTTENGRGTSDGKRGIYCRGGVVNTLHQLNINVGGTATDFGDLTVARTAAHAASNGHGGLDVFHPRAPELYSPTGTVVPRGGGVGQLAIYAIGSNPSQTSDMSFIQINTLGNSLDFGNMTQARYGGGPSSSSTRGLAGGGYDSGGNASNVIDYVEMATKGNGADFGNLTVARFNIAGGVSNDTRGIIGTGSTPSLSNTLDYVTIATIGNASDFGDLSVSRSQTPGTQSNTRGIFAGARSPGFLNTIDYITIASAGNASDFGDLLAAKGRGGGLSSTTRGVFAGGHDPSNDLNVIEYITIASTGDSTDFGDLTAARRLDGCGASNQTRGLFMGGYDNPAGGYSDVLDYITIASTGNATDFGDLNVASGSGSVLCNGHGGLQ